MSLYFVHGITLSLQQLKLIPRYWALTVRHVGRAPLHSRHQSSSQPWMWAQEMIPMHLVVWQLRKNCQGRSPLPPLSDHCQRWMANIGHLDPCYTKHVSRHLRIGSVPMKRKYCTHPNLIHTAVQTITEKLLSILNTMDVSIGSVREKEKKYFVCSFCTFFLL